MKKRYGYTYLGVYVFSILFWMWVCSKGYVRTDSLLINFCSIALFFIFLNAVYIQLIKCNKERSFLDLWQIPLIIWLSSLVIDNVPLMVNMSVVIFVTVLLVHHFVSKGKKVSKLSIFALYIASVTSLRISYFSIPLIVLAIVIDTNNKYSYSDFERVNILPVSKKAQKIAVPLTVLLLVVICYGLGMGTIEINIFLHYMGCIYILMLLINLEEPVGEFDEMKAFYYLASYIEDERDAFSRVLHDEIIQEARASYNLLLLKEPEIDGARNIIGDMEKRARSLMNFYSSSLFNEFDMADNIENLTSSISLLYPKSRIKTVVNVSKEAQIMLENESVSRLVFQISKELINNVYKHSRSSFLHYDIELKDENTIKIKCISDGATFEDYEKTKSSKGGVLMLRLLIKRNNGTMEYGYSNGVLSSDVEIKAGEST